MAAAAIVLALLAGIGVYAYAAGADKRAEDNASFVPALVANADIAKGTTGAEVIQAGLVHTERVAKGSVPPSIYTNENQLLKKVAAAGINAKQFITASTFVSPEEGGTSAFSTAISSTQYVAVTITVDQDRGVANQIAPGDRVDIADRAPDDKGNPTGPYTYIMRGVKVLAVGATTVAQQPASPGGAAPPASGANVITFEVTPDDALRLISANSQGGVYLVLLPPGAVTGTQANAGTGTASGTAKAASGN